MLLDLFLSLPFCRCVDILKAWTQHRMVQLAKIWARGLFIFIMLVLEKLWKRVWLCSHTFLFFFIGWGWGVFVLIPVWVCLVGFCFVYHTAVRSQRPGPALNPADGLMSIVDRLTWRGYVTWRARDKSPQVADYDTGLPFVCWLTRSAHKNRCIFFLILSSPMFESVLKSSKSSFSLNFFIFLLFYLTHNQYNITHDHPFVHSLN